MFPGRGPSLEEGEPETLKKLRLQDESLPFFCLGPIFCGRNRLPITRLYPKIVRGLLAGVIGFEPMNMGTKIPCLTAWRNPNVRVRSSSAHTLYNNYEEGGVSVSYVETLYRTTCYVMRHPQHIAFPSRFRLWPCS